MNSASRILLTVVLLSLVVAAGVIGTQSPNPGAVEIALDDGSARGFAAIQDYPYDRLLAEFKTAGVTTLLIREKSLAELLAHGQTGYPASFPVEVAVFRGREPVAAGLSRGALPVPPGEFRVEETYVVVRRNPELAGWLQAMLSARLGEDRVRRLPITASADSGSRAEVAVIGVWADLGPAEAPWQGLLQMPLGILPVDVAAAQERGFRVAYQVSQRPAEEGVPPYRPADLAAVLQFPGPPGLVWMEGAEVPGFPDRVAETASLLEEQGAVLALGRNRSGSGPALPAGMDELVARLGHQAVKGYAVSYTDRVSDWVTAAKDRNIRFFVVEAFTLSLDGGADVRTLTQALESFAAGIRQAGLTVGAARPADPYAPPGWALGFLGLAAGAAGLALLLEFRPVGPGTRAVLWLLGAGLLAGTPVLVMLHSAGVQAAALLAAVALPSLGVIRAGRRRLPEPGPDPGVTPAGGALAGLGADLRLGLHLVLQVALYATAAGLLVHALLSHRRFWLEVDLFRGVKLELVAPILLFLAHWAWTARGQIRQRGRAWLESPLRFGAVLVGAGALLAAGLLIVRSEYAGAQLGALQVQAVTGLELKVRQVLENALYVRPRFKEFLVGYPALFLAAFLWRRGRATWARAVLAVGAVAAASVANSFSHAHIAAGLTLLRTAHGLWLGGLVGVAVTIAAFYVWRARRDVDA